MFSLVVHFSESEILTIFLFSKTFTSLAKDFLMFSYGVRWLAANFIAWAQLNADWLSLWLLSHSFFEDSHSRIFNRTVSRRLFDFFENRIFEARGWSKELDDFWTHVTSGWIQRSSRYTAYPMEENKKQEWVKIFLKGLINWTLFNLWFHLFSKHSIPTHYLT